MTGLEFRFQDYGFTSMIELVSQLDDIFFIQRGNGNPDWMLFDVQSAPAGAKNYDSDQEGTWRLKYETMEIVISICLLTM